MDAWRIAIVVIVALFVVMVVLRMAPGGDAARRAERRLERETRRKSREERRLVRWLRALPLDSKLRVREALQEMIDGATQPPE
jgi:hypothetical protein